MLSFEAVTKVYEGRNGAVEAVAGIDLEVAAHEFVTVLGPSGCGKSTLLHLTGGFEQPTSGSIRLDGEPVTEPGRDRGMVFQQPTLLPWKTVRDNVAWPLRVIGTSKRAARATADDLLGLVGLRGFERNYPNELSGGMRQRAAIARTLTMEPRVLLMDEPFGALDSQTRELMQEELNRIWQTARLTVLFITHDINEAVFLGDRVVVMSARPGRVIDDVRIELERPRSDDTKRDPRFGEYHTAFWEQLRGQMAGEGVER